ncbi:HAD domain-containing protein [Cupriavidus sp. CuC1]|uniref:HAD domain-containing protein n=1 Tax=Cupriavidus sp. CuC1 TaxID=3373131 RepID=UPI0037D0E25F
MFLDFDGVLHRFGEPALDEDFNLIENPNLFAWLPVLDRLLVHYPNVRIIVSSDWRRLCNDETLVRLLGPLGVRFIGVVETWGGSRSEEILEEARRRCLTHWLAIDDHPSVEAASREDSRFVACASDSGVSAASVQAELQRKLAALTDDGQTTPVPTDFPRAKLVSALSGVQSKVAVALAGVQYVQPTASDVERRERWEICEDLAQQLRDYCRRKERENPTWSREFNLGRMRSGVERKVRSGKWDISHDETAWVLERVVALLG